MQQQNRAVVYDQELKLEAFYFEDVCQPFPGHFHPYYVLGLVEQGERSLVCSGREYAIRPGSVLLLNPGDSHACSQTGDVPLCYRGIRIQPLRMRQLQEELYGGGEPVVFGQNAVDDPDAACALRLCHRLMLEKSFALEKEESLLLLLSLLMSRYGGQPEGEAPECDAAVEKVCEYIARHYAWHISLEQLCRHAGLAKSTLLRAFARAKGATPYSYLENIRVTEAEKLLRQGVPPAEAALRTGFFDQSHFTHRFQRMIGLTPGAYREIFRPGMAAPAEAEAGQEEKTNETA